jgi:hypothetical protein
MISSVRNFSVRILDADRCTIVIFQILDIKSNYLPGIVHCLLYCTITYTVIARLRFSENIKNIYIYNLETFINVKKTLSIRQGDQIFTLLRPYSQPQTNTEYLIAGTKSPVTNLTYEPIGRIILITAWLKSNYLSLSN